MVVKLDGFRDRGSRLTVIRRLHGVVWLCHCDCGNDCTALTGQIRTGSKLSCGCLRREQSRDKGKRRVNPERDTEMRRLRRLGFTCAALGKMFKVSTSRAWLLVNRDGKVKVEPDKRFDQDR